MGVFVQTFCGKWILPCDNFLKWTGPYGGKQTHHDLYSPVRILRHNHIFRGVFQYGLKRVTISGNKQVFYRLEFQHGINLSITLPCSLI